ncbi:outer membrane beta-barrel protein [Fulvivirga ligni]|uniref:outer membrane beta-barrel protein n=1 Tax=Fulvivirga ligni TaxID=2904246 RepID=UPI001F19FA69|nr:outer membrane beta-barrel protein [Fulvivirga ligni]UII22353.1 outer membrane beta-barrel protein [Fulvivirga ligni]
MDDKSFDKYIKEKVSSFNDTHVDENALASFHARMQGIEYIPWYVKYREFMRIAAAVIIVSLLNFGAYSYFYNGENEELKAALTELQAKENDHNALKAQLAFWKNEATEKTGSDTVYIEKKIVTQVPVYLTSNHTYRQNDDNDIYLGASKDISKEIKTFLTEYDLASMDSEGNVYLKNNNQELAWLKGKGINFSNHYVFNPRIEKVELPVLDPVVEKKATKLSVAVLRDMEKRKMNGVGFQYGPELGFNRTFTKVGEGHPGVAAGLGAEFILSPALRVETGINYAFTSYSVNDVDKLGDDVNKYPSIDNSIGELHSIDARAHTVAVPVHLKYNHPISHDRYLFVSSGISPRAYLSQRYNYSYTFDYNGDSKDEEHFAVDIQASKINDEPHFYLGTADVSLGLEKKLENNSHLLLALFYQKGITAMGSEEQQLEMVGVKSALRFRVK